MDDLHIFPFCRQSHIAGLKDALTIVERISEVDAGHGSPYARLAVDRLTARIAELTEPEAA